MSCARVGVGRSISGVVLGEHNVTRQAHLIVYSAC